MSDLYEDARGVIQTVRLRGKRVNILFSKAGTYRSGDKHPVRQHDAIVSGRVDITLNHGGPGASFIQLYPGGSVTIDPDIPHLFYFPVDTVMLEWWGEGDEPRVEYYPPYRDVVERHLREMKG